MNFNHTADTIAAKKVPGGKFIQQSFVGNVTVSEAAIDTYQQAKMLSMTLTDADGKTAKFIKVQFIDMEGNENFEGKDRIMDICSITGITNFNGTNPEVFNGKTFEAAIKVQPKKSGKNAGNPQIFMNDVFGPEHKTVKEAADGKEAKSFAYWTGALANDEFVPFTGKGKGAAGKTVEERVAASGGGAVNPFAGADDNGFPFK